MEAQTKVAVRIRPQLAEKPLRNFVRQISDDPPILFVNDKQKKCYSFDHVFDESRTQVEVFEALVRPLVDHVLEGINCTIFAYGQTGTGKSYTMGTDCLFNDEKNMGVIPRALKEFLRCLVDFEDTKVEISYYEIYNKKVYDLLSCNKVVLHVKDFQVNGLTSVEIGNQADAERYLFLGNKNRHVSSTKLNSGSSRSHAIFVISCKTMKRNGKEVVAKLNLVDLAGSESVKKTGNVGSTFLEGVNINQGLLSIGKVISALSTTSYVPYRDSMITSVLKDSLNPKTFITLIACVSFNWDDRNETIQTFDFAQQAKKVRSDVELHSIAEEYQRKQWSILGDMTNVQKGEFVTPFKIPRTSKRSHFSTPMTVKSKISRHANHSTKMCQSHDPPSSTPFLKPKPPITNPVRTEETLNPPSPIPPIKKATNLREIENCYETTESEKMNKSKLQKRIAYIVELNSRILDECKNICNGSLENGGIDTTCLNNLKLTPIFKVPKLIEKSTQLPRRSLRLNATVDTNISDVNDVSVLRRSIRIAERSVRAAEQMTRVSPKKSRTNSKRSRTTKKQQQKAKEATYKNKTSVQKYVLDLLNTGTERQLQILQTIGPKTAKQILIFRQLNGKFNSVTELSKMPWHFTSAYERFLTANFVK